MGRKTPLAQTLNCPKNSDDGQFGTILDSLTLLIFIPVMLVYSPLLTLIVLGFCGIIFGTTGNTLLQTTVPDHLRGRVMSLYFLLFAGSTPIGASFIGVLSTAFNVSDALLMCAVLCALGVGIGWVYDRRVLRRAV